VADPDAVLRIGEVSRRTGVAVPTLRAWERRYGLLEPDRTEGGHRLYREADVERVRAMSRLLDDGWSAAAAAREVQRVPATVTPLRPIAITGSPVTAAERLVQRLETAIDAFDSQEADSAVDDVFARLEVPRALDEVLLPVLRHVGEGWETDPRVIAREHFASNTLRPRLQRLLTTTRRGAARTCLAVAPEGEEHDLGLLAAAAVAVDAGWRVHYLGARVPTTALERSVAELRPDLVLVGSMFRGHAEAFLDEAPRLPGTAVVLGGAGFRPDDTTRMPSAVVHQGPISDLPATMTRALAPRSGAFGG
jgi:MerR family transcriptional regulator, light-induced transcriptional regulator